MRITLLTVGSRGDVQPYLALGIGLKAAGHSVQFATEEIYRSLVTQYGLEFAPLPGNSRLRHHEAEWLDYLESTEDNVLRSIWTCTQNFVLPTLRSQLDAAWNICQGTDAIVSSPAVFGSTHIAYKLGVPFYRAWTCPAHETRAFPHAWSRLPDQQWFGGLLNKNSTHLIERPFWRSVAPYINQWRQEQLDLPPFGEDQNELDQFRRTPTLYCYSPALLPKPKDWGNWVHVTGYWFLDQPFEPESVCDLTAFLKSGEPPIYVGFGSAVDYYSQAVIRTAIAAILASGQRAVLEAGWADLPDLHLPPQIYKLPAGAVPHSWLFPQMSALIHHGGAGTIGEGLRAGKPTIVVYQKFTDYWFWGQQVTKQGVGTKPFHRRSLKSNSLAAAVHKVVTDSTIRSRAAQLGAQIRAENGVQSAIAAFHQHLPSHLRYSVMTRAEDTVPTPVTSGIRGEVA
jgi:sterol 3beta-glucosyltransferase